MEVEVTKHSKTKKSIEQVVVTLSENKKGNNSGSETQTDDDDLFTCKSTEDSQPRIIRERQKLKIKKRQGEVTVDTFTYVCQLHHNKYDHNTYKQEDNPDYWKENQNFYGVKCYHCKKDFTTKSSKPSMNKPAYICQGSLVGCKVALHNQCYQSQVSPDNKSIGKSRRVLRKRKK